MWRCLCSLALVVVLCPKPAAAERRPVLFEHQTLTSSFFTGEVAVDSESDVALIALNNGTVAVTKRNSAGFWSTGVVLSGSTSSFGIEIAFDGGWALIAEEQGAGVIRSYQYVGGVFQPAGIIGAGAPSTGTAFGYRMALSADARFAAVASFDYDDPAYAGDDHGKVSLFQRQSDGSWTFRTTVTAGARTQSDGRFGHAVALSGDGRRLIVGSSSRVHIFERSPATNILTEVQVLEPGVLGFGWDVDITEDGQTIVVGYPSGNSDRGGVGIYRQIEGMWYLFHELSPYLASHRLGWAVAASPGVVATGTMSYTSNNLLFSAFLAWPKNLEAPANWFIPQQPQPIKFEDRASRMEISMDGGWVFIGLLTNNSLPRVIVYSIYTPPPTSNSDFNASGTTDVAVYRPSTRTWYIRNQFGVQFGDPGDRPVPADYNGDRQTDVAVYRPTTGVWYIRNQGGVQFGDPGDIPVPADYNGDGTADIAVYRPSNGWWYMRGRPGVQWGDPGDIPVPADYNGDGLADIAVYRPSNGMWYVRYLFAVSFGDLGDIPVAADYNGDGYVDFAVYRPSTGVWFVRNQFAATFGDGGDVPQPGDYDGDGADDIAVYRPSTGTWYVRNQFGVRFGDAGDVPVAYRPELR